MKKVGTIYVLCSAYYVTGGTEVLHQLVYFLNSGFEIRAKIFYPNIDWKFEVTPTPRRFEKYTGGHFVEHIEDNSDNILIVPETMASYLKGYSKVRKVLWWLSYDYFFSKYGIRIQDSTITRKARQIIKQKMNLYPFNEINEILHGKSVTLHLAQSSYAFNKLKLKGVDNIAMLSDFINPDTFLCEESTSKQDQVVFNPLKGYEFTRKLMEAAPLIKWVPLEKMNPMEVQACLAKSKVYIDFGDHPGKDRLPREAAMNGCIILTNKRGAANNSLDIPIPRSYKFSDSKDCIPDIIWTLHSCLKNYNDRYQDFAEYRNLINVEQNVFAKQIASFISRLKVFSSKGVPDDLFNIC